MNETGTCYSIFKQVGNRCSSQSMKYRGGLMLPKMINNPYFRHQINKKHQNLNKLSYNPHTFLVVNPVVANKRNVYSKSTMNRKCLKDKSINGHSTQENFHRNNNIPFKNRGHRNSRLNYKTTVKVCIMESPLNVLRFNIENAKAISSKKENKIAYLEPTNSGCYDRVSKEYRRMEEYFSEQRVDQAETEDYLDEAVLSQIYN